MKKRMLLLGMVIWMVAALVGWGKDTYFESIPYVG